MADGDHVDGDRAGSTVRFLGLSQADVAEIDELLTDGAAPDDLRFEEDILPPERLGEPATFVLIAVATLASLRVLAAFLQRKRRRERIRYTVEVVGPDGSRRTETLELERSEAEAPTPDLVEKLATLTSVPVEQVRGLFG